MMGEPGWCDDCRDFHISTCPWAQIVERYKVHSGPPDPIGSPWRIRYEWEGSYCELPENRNALHKRGNDE